MALHDPFNMFQVDIDRHEITVMVLENSVIYSRLCYPNL